MKTILTLIVALLTYVAYNQHKSIEQLTIKMGEMSMILDEVCLVVDKKYFPSEK